MEQEEVREVLKQIGLPNHSDAVNILELARELIEIKELVSSSVLAKPMLSHKFSYKLAIELVSDFLKENQMNLTNETFELELQAKKRGYRDPTAPSIQHLVQRKKTQKGAQKRRR